MPRPRPQTSLLQTAIETHRKRHQSFGVVLCVTLSVVVLAAVLPGAVLIDEAARDADGLYAKGMPITKRIIDGLERCRIIAPHSESQ